MSIFDYPRINFKGTLQLIALIDSKNAQGILQTTKRSLWMSIHYMPRTRDMSASRLKLRKVL